MLRVLPIIVSILYLCFVVLWFVGGLVEIPLPLIDAPAPEVSEASLATRLETRLDEAPTLAFIAGAVVCVVLLLALPRFATTKAGSGSWDARHANEAATTIATAEVDHAPLLPGSRLSIPEKIERLKELRRETRDGDTASIKAVRLHQRMLERAGRFEHD